MGKVKQVNVIRRLTLDFSILALIFILVGLFAIYNINTVTTLTRIIYTPPLVVSNAALQSNIPIAKMHRYHSFSAKLNRRTHARSVRSQI
jgi:hypothetical protein